MTTRLLQLYPIPDVGKPAELALRGLYTDIPLRKDLPDDVPLVYANFLASLDGRIALYNEKGESATPTSLTSQEDFRLFLELLAQSDCIVTHGAYLRALHEGRLGNVLQLGQDERSRDLMLARTSLGLKPQPDIAIASASLDFPLPDHALHPEQRCMILTGALADPQKVKKWENLGYEVLSAGKARMVEGQPMIEHLTRRGYRRIYLVAGPQMLDTVLRSGLLGRLFQTIHHELVGGSRFHSMIPGEALDGTGRMQLESLYYLPHTSQRAGQWFAQFIPMNPTKEYLS